MPKRYPVKGRKRRKTEEKYDRTEFEDVASEEETQKDSDSESEGEEHVEEKVGNDEKIAEDAANELPGLPIFDGIEKKKSGVIFILQKASLEVAKVGKTYQILNSEDHSNFLRKNNRNPGDYRPDIVHQALLMILDSPINKAGRVQAVYVETEKGVLFEVKPCVRIPRTFKRFAVQLLQKLSISAVGKREKLFRVIKNPVTQYLPPNSRKIGFSYSSDKLVNIQDYVNAADDDTSLVFMVGAMAHGKIEKQEADDYISISEYPMSAAWCIAKIANSMANKWNIN
ncbi:hypothetical protein V2J09_005339 [Rumex salicifolius]